MEILVLGSAAGGGLPQWNCNCANCRAARRGDPAVPPRYQPSLAISSDGETWHLLNTGPDIRQQIAENAPLHPQHGIRHTPVRSIVLTNADIDHILGLLILREARPYTLYSTRWTRRVVLESNAAFRLLTRRPEPVAWEEIGLDAPFHPDGDEAIRITPFPVPGKVPLYLQDDYENDPEATIGLNLEDTRTGRRMVFIPGIQDYTEAIRAQIDQADLLFIDGTTFSDTEMQELGVTHAPTARVMGHWPVGGEDGTVALLRDKPGLRKVFIHINNTNPMLRHGSPEEDYVLGSGWEIAREGMRIAL